MTPVQLFKCLSDETRLRCILLLRQHGQLCVCELTDTLELSQPKISRHLAHLRHCGLLSDRREGQWVCYRINQELPRWAMEMIDVAVAAAEDEDPYRRDRERLYWMNEGNENNRCIA